MIVDELFVTLALASIIENQIKENSCMTYLMPELNQEAMKAKKSCCGSEQNIKSRTEWQNILTT